MPSVLSFLLSVLALVPAVLSHGYIRYHVLDGTQYIGYLPYAAPDFTLAAPSIIRKVPGEGPITTPLQRNITCNQNAVPILNKTGPITAGSQITFQWNGWPHSGPIFTYMAKCKNNDCGTFWGDDRDGVGAWFKIDEAGYDNSTLSWATQKLFDQKFAWHSTIPKCLAPGQYLVRHEIINLSSAYTLGGAQFYPSCAQVTVVGTGTATPGGSSIPGIYSPTEPAIRFNTNLPYTYYPMPGPALFKCPS